MFIIKTQSSSKGATKYYTHRLVESKRDSMGKVYKQTILNLGSNYAVVEGGLKLQMRHIKIYDIKINNLL